MNRIEGRLSERTDQNKLQATDDNSEPSVIDLLNQQLGQVVTRYPLAVVATGLLTGVVLGCLIKRR